MVYLILAIVCSSSMGIVMHYAETAESNKKIMTLVNYICSIALCYVFLEDRQIIPQNKSMGNVLILGIVDGILFLVTLLLYQLNIRKNGTPLTVSFSHLGVLVPTILSIVVFREQPGFYQWFGVAFAIGAILIVNLEKGHSHELGFKIGLVFLFLSGGMADMMSKAFEALGTYEYDGLFLFYTFTMAGALCFIWTVATKSFHLDVKSVAFGVLLGVFNYASTMFLLKALLAMPAFITYPVYSVGVILFINIMNMFLLKEKISRRQVVGMVLISIALVLLQI